MFENILLDIDGVVATLTVNRPDKMNAVNNATVEEIAAALDQIEKNEDLRVMILTGAGEKSFVAGADIGEVKNRSALTGRADTRRRQEVYTRIENLEIPSIAAINGFALGTGLELAMACSIRIASEKARMGQPEVKLGIMPGGRRHPAPAEAYRNGPGHGVDPDGRLHQSGSGACHGPGEQGGGAGRADG